MANDTTSKENPKQHVVVNVRVNSNKNVNEETGGSLILGMLPGQCHGLALL